MGGKNKLDGTAIIYR
ncbi:hypothetical protein KZ305_25430 [Escherichia coli]|nr:hypothetical protein [Escherichia coli]MCG2921434.1 hypothetical protein [Escherichia coli]MCV4753201.1 hypothetical protein [Escherichia coli]